jgi:hypothetical protein
MGSAKAAAEHINPASLEQLLARLNMETQRCQHFEKAYSARLSAERPMHVTSASRKAEDQAASSETPSRDLQRPASARSTTRVSVIASASNLLKSTANAHNYRRAMIAHAADTEHMANDVSTRACGYPAAGPGHLKPAMTAWQSIRLREAKEDHAPRPSSAPSGRQRSGTSRVVRGKAGTRRGTSKVKGDLGSAMLRVHQEHTGDHAPDQAPHAGVPSSTQLPGTQMHLLPTTEDQAQEPALPSSELQVTLSAVRSRHQHELVDHSAVMHALTRMASDRYM